MDKRLKIALWVIALVCVLAIHGKRVHTSRIDAEMNGNAQLAFMCEDAGYEITRDNITIEDPIGWRSLYLILMEHYVWRHWRWHVVFDDEPELDYIFMSHNHKDDPGGWCLVDIVGEGEPQKRFESSGTFRRYCTEASDA